MTLTRNDIYLMLAERGIADESPLAQIAALCEEIKERAGREEDAGETRQLAHMLSRQNDRLHTLIQAALVAWEASASDAVLADALSALSDGYSEIDPRRAD